MEPSALGDDDQIVSVASKQYKLSEFLERKNFKSYEELKRKLDEVLSGNGFNAKSAAELTEDEPEVRSAPEPKSAPVFTPKAASKPSPMDEDDEDVMSYFEKIARED